MPLLSNTCGLLHIFFVALLLFCAASLTRFRRLCFSLHASQWMHARMHAIDRLCHLFCERPSLRRRL